MLIILLMKFTKDPFDIISRTMNIYRILLVFFNSGSYKKVEKYAIVQKIEKYILYIY